MSRIALLSLLASFPLTVPQCGNAQTQAPIAVQRFPAVPQIPPPTTDRLSSSIIPEMMPFAAPLVVETPDIASTLVLANASSEDTSVTVSLFSVDGKTSTRQHISFQPHEKKKLSLSSPGTITKPTDRWGSVTVEQDPRTNGAVVVAGQVLITDHRASMPAYVDEELSMPEMEGSSTLRAVTDQSEGPPMVAITNLSSEIQHVSITCLQDKKSPVSATIAVAAHATARSEACASTSPSTFAEYTTSLEESKLPGVNGIELVGDGAPGSLAAFALAPHHRGQDLIFSSVPFYDPGTIHSSDVIFAGVPIGAQETLPTGVYIPRISLANFSNAPLTFSVYLADTRTTPAKDASGNGQPPMSDMIRTVTIPPHQTGEYVFNGQEAQSGLLHSVIVTTKGTPGTYQAKLVSRSTGILYQVELLAKESLDVNNSGVHPWTVQGDAESHIVLFNHSRRDRKVGVFINSDSTILWANEMILAASETREISINKLQSEQIPDDQGRRLPITTKEGVVDWKTPDSGDITGRLMVTSRDAAMARNFSCGVYYGACQLSFNTLALDIPVGGVLPMYSASANYCVFPTVSNQNHPRCTYGSPTSGTVYYNWNVGPTSIITLNGDGPSQSPNLRGVSAGSGTATLTASAGGCQVTATGNPMVRMPTYFPNIQTLNTEQLTSTTTPSCPSGQAGWQREVIRQVEDQNGTAIPGAGQQMIENVTSGPGPNGLNILIPNKNAPTDYQGQVIDTFNFCSPVCPGYTATSDFTQAITDTWAGQTFNLGTYDLTYSCSSIKFNGALTP
jgi:hypothetical protein